jgi:hypothetical protein
VARGGNQVGEEQCEQQSERSRREQLLHGAGFKSPKKKKVTPTRCKSVGTSARLRRIAPPWIDVFADNIVSLNFIGYMIMCLPFQSSFSVRILGLEGGKSWIPTKALRVAQVSPDVVLQHLSHCLLSLIGLT